MFYDYVLSSYAFLLTCVGWVMCCACSFSPSCKIKNRFMDASVTAMVIV